MKLFNVYEHDKNKLFRLEGLLDQINTIWPQKEIDKIMFVRAIDNDTGKVYGFKKVDESVIAYLLPEELYAGIIDINKLSHEKTFDKIKQQIVKKRFAY